MRASRRLPASDLASARQLWYKWRAGMARPSPRTRRRVRPPAPLCYYVGT